MLCRFLRASAVAGLVAVLVPVAAAHSASAPAGGAPAAACPVLIESAMPVEAGPILAAGDFGPTPVWVHDGRGFWAGRVEGNRALIALTGIGMVNATNTTAAAFDHFGCISAVIFSGTSGGDYIGDVMVPTRWTEDGRHFLPTSPGPLSALRTALKNPVPLIRTTPTGDPFCTCQTTGGTGEPTPVTVEHEPAVQVGGTGLSDDGFGGRAFPCVPEASDVFGCWPCRYPDPQAVAQAGALATTVPPFLQASFVLDYGQNSAPPPGSYVSEDNETAAAFTVAARHHVPFIGFRAASDGGGDPLHLPGFPSEFFVYRQLAADNAAATALAFLGAWHSAQAA